jgi:hypothetical protein
MAKRNSNRPGSRDAPSVAADRMAAVENLLNEMSPAELRDVMRFCEALQLVHSMPDEDEEAACFAALDALEYAR